MVSITGPSPNKIQFYFTKNDNSVSTYLEKASIFIQLLMISSLKLYLKLHLDSANCVDSMTSASTYRIQEIGVAVFYGSGEMFLEFIKCSICKS